MLSSSEANIIKKIIQRQKGSLQQAEEDYCSAFKEAINLLNAASYLCELLQDYVRPYLFRNSSCRSAWSVCT